MRPSSFICLFSSRSLSASYFLSFHFISCVYKDVPLTTRINWLFKNSVIFFRYSLWHRVHFQHVIFDQSCKVIFFCVIFSFRIFCIYFANQSGRVREGRERKSLSVSPLVYSISRSHQRSLFLEHTHRLFLYLSHTHIHAQTHSFSLALFYLRISLLCSYDVFPSQYSTCAQQG